MKVMERKHSLENVTAEHQQVSPAQKDKLYLENVKLLASCKALAISRLVGCPALVVNLQSAIHH